MNITKLPVKETQGYYCITPSLIHLMFICYDVLNNFPVGSASS